MSTLRRRVVDTVSWVWFVALISGIFGSVWASYGCGPSAGEKAVQTGLAALNAARDEFVKVDKDQQEKIVAAATSLEDGRARLAAYREQRAVVLMFFVTAYNALAEAATDPSQTKLATASQALVDVTGAVVGLKAPHQTSAPTSAPSVVVPAVPGSAPASAPASTPVKP